MHARWMFPLVAILLVPTAQLQAADELTAKDATAALRKAVGFFRKQVSASGGYLWRYSADLKLQEGENAAGPTTAWVQPPGTPTVGDAYLTAYELTGDRELLAAARETALALLKGQLQSGGWDYRIEFDPRQRRRYAYRVDGNRAGARNVTTLDDDTTQSALRFLIRVDRTLEFKDKPIHEAATYALQSLLKAQYPNGAWPQRYSEFPKAADYPVKKATYPASWSRKYPKKDYRGYYTFNDNSLADAIDTMFLATEIYKDKRYRAAAEKAGDFIILAQMPGPQPAWAQQYDRGMHPAWARKFEPPSVTGGESQGVLRTLLSLYRRTGKKKYLAPIPRALAYLNKSQLPGGRLARFYELKTNRPLYFVKDTYELTYRDDNLPTHYGFKVGSRLARIEREYQRLLKTDPSQLSLPQRKSKPRMSRSLREQAQQVVAALDERGAWVERGTIRRAGRADRIISTRTFARNVETLARFIAASKEGK
jgi:hypothetical protein